MTLRPYALRAPMWTLMLALACTERTPGDPGSASDPSTSASSSSGSTSTSEPPDPTDGATGSDTGSSTSGASSTTSTGAESSGESSSSSTTGGADALVLDPSTLVFFELPIGSIRHAVGGHDPAHDTCVSIIFMNPGLEQHCDDFEVGEGGLFPYVVVTPGGSPPCMDWDYAGNVTVDAAAGCMQVTSPFPLEIAIDMNLSVSGDLFSGTIAVANK